jgi:carbamoyl-phosphate synthase/aspartate carbamoyltransferase/dihydroorotase
MIRLPGLIDPHVHLREPGATHKEDFDSGTASALAGGVTMVLAMPNTKPPIFDAETLNIALQAAGQKARCDYAQYLGAGSDNSEIVAALAPQVAALKMYLDATFGQLRLEDMTLWMKHFASWPGQTPIVTHSESRSMGAALLIAHLFDKPVHIAHISLREEVLLIKAAKEHGIKVTCEVCPHHLFLSAGGLPYSIAGEPQDRSLCCCGDGLSANRAEVRPRLATPVDVAALWENLDVIDCFATDHAPHTLAEKDGENPPPGFPGLETLLPLLLTAVQEGRLSLEQLVEKSVTNPRRIFNLPVQPETWVDVDETVAYEIRASEMYSRCGWTPFEGWRVRGRVMSVVLRGRQAFKDGKILVEPGFGRNIREKKI